MDQATSSPVMPMEFVGRARLYRQRMTDAATIATAKFHRTSNGACADFQRRQ
jgi:hypothetical protein